VSRQISPFAALTAAEQQIKWLEYQSIRLPYMESSIDSNETEKDKENRLLPKGTERAPETSMHTSQPERPQPPPEVPRVMPDFSKTRHSQYDAVIARLKQAELQSRRAQSLS